MSDDKQGDAKTPGLRETLEELVNAKALAGVRSLVAGWNGEGRSEPHKHRHPDKLGARIDTNCGAIYALDEAMQKALAALAPGNAGVVEAERPAVSIKPMALADGRTDYFVSIKVGDREVTPHVFREEYKAAYHVALYDWLLNGSGEEPNCVEFGPDDWPARVAAPTPAALDPVREALKVCREMLRGEMLESAVVDVETMTPLGTLIDRALSHPAPGNAGEEGKVTSTDRTKEDSNG